MQVFTSPGPAGPFTYRHALSAVYGGLADLLIFTDGPDAYLVYNSRRPPPDAGVKLRYTFVVRLDADWYDVIPSTLSPLQACLGVSWVAWCWQRSWPPVLAIYRRRAVPRASCASTCGGCWNSSAP